MYIEEGTAGFKETLAKVRKAVHKVIPRELSPTRLLEKYATDTKKKGVAKVAKVASLSEAMNAAQDSQLAQQIALLDSANPLTSPLPDEIAADFPAAKPAPKPGLPGWAPWAFGGLLVLGGITLYRRRR